MVAPPWWSMDAGVYRVPNKRDFVIEFSFFTASISRQNLTVTQIETPGSVILNKKVLSLFEIDRMTEEVQPLHVTQLQRQCSRSFCMRDQAKQEQHLLAPFSYSPFRPATGTKRVRSI